MSSDFSEDSRHSDSLDASIFDSNNSHQVVDALDAHKRDRFELLSAYLDGEVTAAERKQVESWLATDLTVQRLHTRLLNLRYGLQDMPVPATNQPVEQTVEQVFARIDRKPKVALVWGVGAAVAAGLIGLLTSILPGERPFAPQVAERTQPNPVQVDGQAPTATVSPETLMIALDHPPIEIPVPKRGVTPMNESTQGTWLYPDSNQDIR